jgi:integrase
MTHEAIETPKRTDTTRTRAMPKLDKKLDDALMRRMPVPPKGNVLHYDPELKGFAARVTHKGARAFVLAYRFKGEERRDTIGDFPAWGAKAARTVAENWRRDARLGVDPRPEPEPEPAEDATFKARAEAFLEHGRRKRGLPLRPATKREYRRALLTYAKSLHDRPLAEVRRGEVATVIQRIAKDHGEVAAMRCRAALSRLWTWAIANGHAEGNPVSGTEGYAAPKRSRVLTDDELRVVWKATAEQTDFNLIVRLCLWLGTRRGEPGGMADSELAGELWTIPDTRTKNHRPLALPMPRQAVAALDAWQGQRRKECEARKQEPRPKLFGRGDNGFSGWSAAKLRLDSRVARLNAEQRLGRKLAENEKPAPQDAVDFDLHDCRRTVETRLARLRVPKEVANKILNHAAGPITEAYDLHDYLPEKAEALQAWADTLERIVGEAPSNVVPVRSAS